MRLNRALALLAFAAFRPADAQDSTTADTARCNSPPLQTRIGSLRLIGSDGEDRWRLAQLIGEGEPDGYLLRSASRNTQVANSCGKQPTVVDLLIPAGRLVYNQSLPRGGNLDGLWAGRGFSGQAIAGVRLSVGRFRVTMAPEIRWSQNRVFEVAPPPFFMPPVPSDISPFASPWNISPLVAGGRYSIDTPLRFGSGSFTEIDWGQSGAFVVWEQLTLGVTSEQSWWGPGIRNALLMSNNAPGIPRVELRSTRPLASGIGRFEGRWFAGSLSESPYFNNHPEDDNQWLVGLGVVWRPPRSSDIEVGVARTVFGPSDDPFEPYRPFEVFSNVAQPRFYAYSDTNYRRSKDQLFSLFARFRIPEDSFSAHVELGRAAQPVNLRDLLVEPTHSLAYTVGVEYARGIAARRILRVQVELTSAEQSSTYLHRATPSWYTSTAIRQGYTNQGRVVGAQIGPGSSGQFVAVDVVAPDWRAGASFSRQRWNTDAFVNLPFPEAQGFCEFDTTLSPALRVARTLRPVGSVQLDLYADKRYNAFFNHTSGCPTGLTRRDVRNTSMSLSFTPVSF